MLCLDNQYIIANISDCYKMEFFYSNLVSNLFIFSANNNPNKSIAKNYKK